MRCSKSSTVTAPSDHTIARSDSALVCLRRLAVSNGNEWGFFPKLLLAKGRSFCGYAVEQFSDDEYDCDFENHKVWYFSSHLLLSYMALLCLLFEKIDKIEL